MYYDYFGLKQAPFKITPDPSMFFPGGDRGAVLEALMYAITQGEGIVKVVGEVGTGKTMLCRMLEVELPDNVEVVYLANPSLSPENILHAIAFELKLNVSETDNRLKVMNELQNYLLERHANNKQIVVFVEEAQGMPIATLEEIRLLSNLETSQYKLLQIVLFGQPELDQMISRKEIRQLKERITYSFQLMPFEKDDVKDYLNSRLRVCGYRSSDVFSASAVKAISKYSRGLLRRINILADKALLAAYAGNTHKVTSAHVKIAARDSEFIVKKSGLTPVLISMAAFILLIIIGGLVFPGKINQGIHAIQKSFDAYVMPADARVSDEALLQDPVPEAQETKRLAQSPQASAEIKQQSVKKTPIETRYLPQDADVQPQAKISKDEKLLDARLEESDLLGLGKLDLGISIQDAVNYEIASADNEAGSLTNPDTTKQNSIKSAVAASGNALQSMTAKPIAIGMTEQEFARFRQQLAALPPEVGLDTQSEDVCEKCSSIIYRPKAGRPDLGQ